MNLESQFDVRSITALDCAKPKRGRVISENALQCIEIISVLPMDIERLHRDFEELQEGIDGQLYSVFFSITMQIYSRDLANLFENLGKERLIKGGIRADHHCARFDLANQPAPRVDTYVLLHWLPYACSCDPSFAEVAMT